MDALSLHQVWVEYGDKIVLERVNLKVAPGSFVSIIGPSGAGKTTLLRLILGQEAPTRGKAALFGELLRAEPGPDRGVVFQRYSVFPHLNARENVVFGLECAGSALRGRLWGRKRRDALDAADAMLAAVGLKDARKVFPAQMSGGMQQRVAIAQALIMKPKVLLLDEPFGALDPGVRVDMHGLITQIWGEFGLTIFMVTHDIKEAFALGTRVLALDKPRIDEQAPHRYGATIVYDMSMDKKVRAELPPEIAAISGEAAS
ncbi:MAG: ATP-binding cassette domain-containing protein [Hyphomonadaceae bacterium]|nr:ATP-binding cassette domain-containing protein [Hyphomonadaceae bacterium]